MPDLRSAGKKNDVYKLSKWQPTSRRNAVSDDRRSGAAPHDTLTQRDRWRFRAAIAEVTAR